MRGVAEGICGREKSATSLCLRIAMSAAELRARVCFNKRLSLAEGARIFFAGEDSNRRRLPRLAENGLSLKKQGDCGTYEVVNSSGRRYLFREGAARGESVEI